VRSPLVIGSGAGGNLRALMKLADTSWPLPFRRARQSSHFCPRRRSRAPALSLRYRAARRWARVLRGRSGLGVHSAPGPYTAARARKAAAGSSGSIRASSRRSPRSPDSRGASGP
jgi:hypothetical protein